jgi:hypothetical protein
MDKTWIHRYNPHTKEQFMEWRHTGQWFPASKVHDTEVTMQACYSDNFTFFLFSKNYFLTTIRVPFCRKLRKHLSAEYRRK